MALRRARRVKRAGDLEVFALVAERLDLGRIEKASRRLVLGKGVVGPGIPEPFHDIGEFVGALVARVAGDVFAVVEVQRVEGVGCRDQVPTGATAADVVERGEAPRDMKRLVIGRGGGGDESDMLCHHGQRGQERDGLEHPRPVGRRGGGEKIRLVHIAHAVAVGEEEEVHLAGLGDLGEAHRIGDVRGRFVPGLRVPPFPHMAALSVGVGGKDHRHGRRIRQQLGPGCKECRHRPDLSSGPCPRPHRALRMSEVGLP